MDFRDSPAEAEFRAKVGAWLREHLPPFQERYRRARDGEERLEIAAGWQHELFEGGYGALGWPAEFGGSEASPQERYLAVEEAAKLGAPWHLNMAVTLGWCAPALLAFGTRAQKEQHLKTMLSGDEVWCQMFSEPNAGSDLASLITRAEQRGDRFVINGQKVWSSGAHWSRYGILLARSSDGPRYRNLTFFAIDMQTPGITVRPIRQITGESDFAEVFFTDCEVPVESVVGEVDAGWNVALYTLLNERVALSAGAGAAVIAVQGLDRLLNLVRGSGRGADPIYRQKTAQAWIEAEANRLTGYRVLDAQFKGRPPGPEASILKLSGDLWTQRLSELAVEMLGMEGALADGDGWAYSLLMTRALTIGGGTSEIQHNIIAERVLGLPRRSSAPAPT
ncbi:MAG TPA: acyl-CoA dehydrogenase family protein [Candidatus Dormibacteraeota bacterium]